MNKEVKEKVKHYYGNIAKKVSSNSKASCCSGISCCSPSCCGDVTNNSNTLLDGAFAGAYIKAVK